MCNNYTPPREQWPELGYRPDWTDRPTPQTLAQPRLSPRSRGPFIRLNGQGQREQAVGQWGLVPPHAPGPKLPYATNNCRSEEVEQKRSFKNAWTRGQRCIVPVGAFWEPCWETFRHVPWRFTRADGQPLALAGLWDTWVDPQTGECLDSYTLFTINADGHPWFGRMHKPDPALPPDAQDKRMVCVLEPTAWDDWLANPDPAAAKRALHAAPAEVFAGAPDAPAGPVALSLF